MRFYVASLIVVLGLTLTGCTQPDRGSSSRDNDGVARQAGKAAYQLSQESKQAAKKAAKELNKAAREAREGWNEAKRESGKGGAKR